MNAPVFRRTMLATCWLPVMGMVLAIVVQYLRITGRPSEYIATGRIMVGVQMKLGGKDELQPSELPADFCGTQIVLLESRRIRESALERVRGLRPDLKEVAVSIQVTRTKGSWILNVTGVGLEPHYTRAYLDAVLDEYMAMRRVRVHRRNCPHGRHFPTRCGTLVLTQSSIFVT
jgi:hypothetical protein